MFEVWVYSVCYYYYLKECVIGVLIGGVYKVYLFVEFGWSLSVIYDMLGGRLIEVCFDIEYQIGFVFDVEGYEILLVIVYWFVWFVFYMDMEVFVVKQEVFVCGIDGVFKVS